MIDEEFEKYIDLIMSMCVDYFVSKKITKETFVANLEIIVKKMKQKDELSPGPKAERQKADW